MNLRVHAILPGTRANGPGLRTAVWVQGCSLRCSGCWNPGTWSQAAGTAWDAEALARHVVETAEPGTVGLTLSGGEPFDQAVAVRHFVAAVRRQRPEWTLFAWTGYETSELVADRERWALLLYVDTLVTGRFQREQVLAPGTKPYCGSANQEARHLTGRVTMDGASHVVMEFHLGLDGRIVSTGFPGDESAHRTGSVQEG